MDAPEFLREDHEKVLALLDELERGPAGGRAVADGGDLEHRKRLVTDLVMAESAHEALEEQFFWPSVQHWLEDGKDLARPALEQEQSAKSLLARLEKAYEQDTVWPLVRRALAHSQLEAVGKKMAKAAKLAPTRPHPHTPPKPGVIKTAGMAAAATDKVRDAATGRGKAET